MHSILRAKGAIEYASECRGALLPMGKWVAESKATDTGRARARALSRSLMLSLLLLVSQSPRTMNVITLSLSLLLFTHYAFEPPHMHRNIPCASAPGENCDGDAREREVARPWLERLRHQCSIVYQTPDDTMRFRWTIDRNLFFFGPRSSNAQVADHRVYFYSPRCWELFRVSNLETIIQLHQWWKFVWNYSEQRPWVSSTPDGITFDPSFYRARGRLWFCSNFR